MNRNEQFVQDLSALLVKRKAFTEQEAVAIQQSFSDRSKDSFDYFLLDEGLIEEEELLSALSEYYQVPSFDVGGYFFNSQLLHLFPKDMLLRNDFIPLDVDEDILVVVASDPSNESLLTLINNYVEYEIVLLVGLKRDINDAVKEFYDESPTMDNQDEDLREERRLRAEEEQMEEDTSLLDPDELAGQEDAGDEEE